jgi:hypothetical protein
MVSVTITLLAVFTDIAAILQRDKLRFCNITQLDLLFYGEHFSKDRDMSAPHRTPDTSGSGPI